MRIRGWLPLAVAGIAGAVQAGDLRSDFVQQWPLQVAQSDAGMYQLTLDGSVYRVARDAQLRDVAVLDARGDEMPSALLPAEVAAQATPRRQRVPVFALPAGAEAARGDLQLIAERDASGAVRRLEGRVATGASTRDGAGPGWLVDASGVREAPRALWLDWDATTPVQAQLRVEGSDDLRDWRVLAADATVMALDNNGQRLQQRRIALEQGARYLRLVPVSGALPALTQVEVELEGAAAPAQWQQLDLQGTAQETRVFYTLPGRFPIAQVDVQGARAEAVEWVVESRDGDQAPWLQRAGPWLGYRLGSAAAASPPQPVSGGSVRDRQWRLLAAQGRRTGVPTLRVGYQPERLLFLAQGQAPYALVAGSARAQRTEAPLTSMLAALRQERGAQWQPATARIAGAAQPLAGAAALQPAAVPRDWKRWLLWALLVGGAVVVGGFAVSLLRSASANRDA
ncbi:DUF3999 domain-containing protein [Xanthomonas campestris]|uniref:DUF3999 domain-containing protein n=1 Tax=Xanthomonas campestris TaxID=339 RepID=UPI0023E9FD29|nr:hypothetical protein [Xanthomonas campestris]